MSEASAAGAGGTAHGVAHGRILARNTLLNLAGLTLPLVIAAAAMPPVVRGLGAARFGILSLVGMLLSYSGELGFGRATTKFAAEVHGTGEPGRLAHIAWATAAVQLAIGIVAGGALLLATPALATRLLAMPPELVDETRACLYGVAALVPVLLVASAFRGLLEALQRFDLVNAVRFPTTAASFLLPLLGLWLGFGLPGIVALVLASRVLSLLAYFGLAARVVPTLRRPALGAEPLRPLVAFGSWAAVSTLVSPAIVQVERVLLGMLVGVAALGYYAPAFEMVTRLSVVPASLVATLFPAFSALGGRRDGEGIERLTTQSTKFILCTVGPLVLVVIVSASDVLRLWLGDDFARSSALALQILAVGVLVNALAQVPFALTQGLGRADLTAKFHLLELPIHLVVAFALVRAFGIPGAALAWTLRVTFDAALLFGGVLRTTALPARAFLGAHVTRTAALLLAGSIGTALLMAATPSAAGRLAVAAAALPAVAFALWRFALAAGDRAQVTALLRIARR